MFDVDSLLTAEVSGEMSTVTPTLEPGDYEAYIAGVDVKSFQIREGDNAGETRYILKVKWQVMDQPEWEEKYGYKPTVIQDIWLDFNENGLDRAEGKNTKLGKVRQAVGQNVPGEPWAPGNLVGGSAMVNVGRRLAPNGEVYSEIKGVREAE